MPGRLEREEILKSSAATGRRLGWGAAPFSARAGDLMRIDGPAILHMLAPPKPNVADNWTDKHFAVLLGYDPARGAQGIRTRRRE